MKSRGGFAVPPLSRMMRVRPSKALTATWMGLPGGQGRSEFSGEWAAMSSRRRPALSHSRLPLMRRLEAATAAAGTSSE